MRKAPCYGCKRRSAICHAQCNDYPVWAAELARERAAQEVAKQADAHTKLTIERNCKRAKTKRRVGQR